MMYVDVSKLKISEIESILGIRKDPWYKNSLFWEILCVFVIFANAIMIIILESLK